MTAVEDLFQKKMAKKQEHAAAVATRGQQDQVTSLSDDSKQQIQNIIRMNKVVVFGKSYCPFCRQAKMLFQSIQGLDFLYIDINDENHDGWQHYIASFAKEQADASITNNTLSVPQIFIHGNYVGGADDVADMLADKRLETMLGMKT